MSATEVIRFYTLRSEVLRIYPLSSEVLRIYTLSSEVVRIYTLSSEVVRKGVVLPPWQYLALQQVGGHGHLPARYVGA